jgi:RNA polymerase sigma-70 factor (ECF subfamily)
VSIAAIDPAPALVLLELARTGDRDAFQHLAEPHRRELQLHCYRMLGSLQDAEDLVQETLLRAWRGIERFEGRASVRSWLYRIATNACLNALASRSNARRLLPEAHGPPSDRLPDGGPAAEITWLEPYPDALLEGIADAAPGPDARYELHESVQLAFVAAIQHLPARQRAVLLLRDVLGWSAAETAILLDASLPSVNSALQRARATLGQRLPNGQTDSQAAPDDRQRLLLERYVQTWESADLDGFIALLREDTILSMPPNPEWYLGPAAIRRFLAYAWKAGGPTGRRFLPTAANGQPAFALYAHGHSATEFPAHSIWLLTLRDDAIAGLTGFIDARLFARFGLPAALPMPGTAPVVPPA